MARCEVLFHLAERDPFEVARVAADLNGTFSYLIR